MFSVVPIGDVRWVSAVMGLGQECRDIHFDQRMLAPYVTAFKWKALLAVTSSQDGYIVQPVLVTPEGELRHAYNFGGPMPSSDLVNAQEHVDNLNDWARKQGLVKQYCTLIPFLSEKQTELLKTTDIITERKKDSVIIDLKDQKIRGTTRRMANKAREAGVVIKSHPLSDIKDFYKIYETTMDRKNAKDHWRFPVSWFESFVRFLKPTLLLAEYKGNIEAGCLVIYSQQYPVAYYHFAGSYNTHPSLGINHLMVLAASEFIKTSGVRYLYLGGGITDNPNDNLLIFKSGFSQKRLPVHSYEVLL